MPGATPPAGSGNKKAGKGIGLIKPVTKGQRLPIAIMSSTVSLILFAAAYYFAYLPEVKKEQLAEAAAVQAQQQASDAQKALDAAKKQAALAAAQAPTQATLTVDSKPTGASVTIGSEHLTTPAKVTDLTPGSVNVVIHLDGYEDYNQTVTVSVDKPTDLGTVDLAPMAGSLSLTSPQDNVTYTLTGPDGYSKTGQIPDNLSGLAPGDYKLNAVQGDWKLDQIVFTIHDKDSLQKEIKFPYANATITSTPPGAVVRNGRTVLGQTPLTLTQQHPGTLNLSVDLAPYITQHISLVLPEFGNVTRSLTLQQGKNFIAACGLPMIWIPDGGFWAGKYLMPQSEFEEVAGFNPSTFRRSNLPVDSITWEDAKIFCQKLTEFERKAGKLPSGYHYALPTETQWSALCADANIDLSAMSRNGTTLDSTQEVGYSEPNKYGIFDALGNLWEWCADTDPQGNHSLRGGSWLSSPDNFPSPDTRNTAAPKYNDRFTGFRVVLVPDGAGDSH